MSKKNTSTTPAFVAKEWDASGSMHLYSYGNMLLRCFVVEVDLSEDVQGDVLQAAVDKALERLPYYRQTLVRKKGLYYYADNDLPFVVAESAEGRPVGGEATNYHMVDVTYTGKTTRFAMNHGFCDGLGLNRLIEAVLYHYFCLKDGVTYADDGIYTESVPYDEAEIFDAFAQKSNVDTKELKKLANGEKRFRLPELGKAGSQGPTMYRLPLKVKTQELISWCKACGASPGSAAAAFASVAIAREHNVSEGVIMSVLPMSLRRFLHADKTFKNCDSAAFLATSADEARTMPVTELAAKLRERMKAQMGEEMGLLLSSSINMITHLGKKMPFFFLKTRVFALPQSRPQDTVYIDYVGGLKANGYDGQIVDVRYLNVDPCGGSAFILMSETAGHFHISFSQTFDSDRYRQAFARVLEEQGIAFELLPASTYLNPLVELPAEQR